jgi:hypothetical protein
MSETPALKFLERVNQINRATAPACQFGEEDDGLIVGASTDLPPLFGPKESRQLTTVKHRLEVWKGLERTSA